MPTSSTRRTTTRRGRSSAARAAIVVQRAAAAPGAPGERRLRAIARAAARGAMQVTLRLVGAAEGRRLNRAFRDRDYATNVLTFPYGVARTRGGKSLLQGDIVLCHPVIAREARAQRKPLIAHYAHLVVHGMLHLRGADHVRAREAARMERAEARILRRLGFADPYAVE
jgi:probable rRNA maturation factor